MVDYKLHNDCKAISAAEYKNSKIKAPADWKRIKTKSNILTGFRAGVYKKDNNIIIVYRGTDANTIGADKYFHSKANCDGAKRGELGALVAKGISDLREFTDLFKNVLVKGMTIAESLEDSAGDQEANRYGREQGKAHPEEDSSVLVDIYRPNGLPNKY